MDVNKINECVEIQSCPAPGRADAVNRRYLLWAGVAGISLALVVYFFGVLPGQRAEKELATWAPVNAKILLSGVGEELKSEPWGNSQREYTSYAPQVEYEYNFGATSYTGKTVSIPAPSFRDPNAAKLMAEKFPVGQTVDARVNPEAPGQSVLQLSSDPTRKAALLGSLMLGILGILGLLMAAFWPK